MAAPDRPPLARRVYRWCFYQTANMLARLFVRLFVRIRITGRDRVPSAGDEHGQFLLICNHISHFDPPILAGTLWRKMAWVVALDMYAHPAGAFFFNGIDAVPVDRSASDRAAVKAVLARIKKGESVGLFPEAGIRAGDRSILGGRTVDGSVGGLAQLGNIPVVPCVMLGTDKLYAKRNWWWRTTVDVAFGAPIPVPTPAEGQSNGDARRAFCDQIATAMRSLADDLRTRYGLTDDDFPKTAQERWAEAEKASA